MVGKRTQQSVHQNTFNCPTASPLQTPYVHVLVKEFDAFVAEASNPANVLARKKRVQQNQEVETIVKEAKAAIRTSKDLKLPDLVPEQGDDGDKTGKVPGTVIDSFAIEMKARES